MLQTPPQQQLGGRTRVLLGQGADDGMFHLQRSDEGGICLDEDIVLLAKGGDVGSGVEGVNFDLIDGGPDARVGGQEFL